MPLPDERPRQSVANLIGRFETQSKQLSVSQGSASRSSSVVSHITGESVKEEVKEKREWPPRSIAEKAAAAAAATSSRPLPLTIKSESASAKKEASAGDEPDIPLTAKALHASHSQVQGELNSYLENWRKDLPKPAEVEPELVTPRPTDIQVSPPAPAPTVQKVAANSPRTPATKTPPTKLPPSSSKSSISAKSPARKTASSSQSLAPPTQPLKQQHTGQSVVSTVSAARRTVSKGPSTPKTPARSESRAKTPTPSRSSGLFAPTAASLAKARNAPPMPPLPVKRATLSVDAMERLSKPTAASLSKARSVAPIPVTPSPKSSPRTTVVKSKTMSSPSKVLPKGKKDQEVSPAARNEAIATSVSNNGGNVSEASGPAQEPHQESIVDGNGHANEPMVEVEQPVPVSEETLGECRDEHEEADFGKASDPDIFEEPVPVPVSPPSGQDESESHQEMANGIGGVKVVGTDLEDIVNLLEGTSIARPSIDDEILEIPDEDDK